MSDNNDRINELLDKLDILLKKQDGFAREIYDLRKEINLLKYTQVIEKPVDKEETEPQIPVIEVRHETIATIYQRHREKKAQQSATLSNNITPAIRSDIEKFIGENLINKIGIAITVIGVAIGAKYSIDHDLISPLTRIILGYMVGLGLLGFGIKLKKNYGNFSAVLLSGAMAIMYFITYAAYSFYELFPQAMAFVLMVIFTVFTVVAAINYNKQVIAHIGLVGAYAVPFLLSDNSGRVFILFTYMAIINIGILFIAFKKYWKPLYYSSFILTWLIYIFWYSAEYTITHFMITLIFLSVFFATFYAIFLGYKLLQKEKFEMGDVVLLLANSFIFYGLGYSIINGHPRGGQLLGLFTLANAVVHFILSAVIYRQKLADRNLFFLVSGLVLVFITIAVPIQLDGNWVTLMWAGEAALIFWIGRTKSISVYERLSYPLMFLAFISIFYDWLMIYWDQQWQQPGTTFTPFFNISFLTALLFIAAFTFINYLNKSKKFLTTPPLKMFSIMNYFIPGTLLFVIYFSIRMEISAYWDHLFADSLIVTNRGNQLRNTNWNFDLLEFKKIWLINYSLLFLAILSFVNIKKIRNRNLGLINLVLNVVAIFAFLTLGLYSLSELRESYLDHSGPATYARTGFNIWIRYISFAFAGVMLASIYKYTREELLRPPSYWRSGFDLLLHLTILWTASSELISWMDVIQFSQSYKLGLSILWGVYSLLLIALGIWKMKQHLRVMAIVLFGITMLKLFAYDIYYLDTIAKTIVFVALGILLLVISFLYNKYKLLISSENKN